MNDGVAMLLERMKTNPEEFISDAGFAYSKWASLIGAYKEHLEEEDRTALTDALCKLHQQRFTEKVMEELIDPKKSDNWGDSVMRAKGIASAEATQGAYTLNASGTITSWENREPLKAHLEALKKEVKESPKTLFGRLFNYQ